MSYEFNSKVLGTISEELASKWQHPEIAGDSILLFSGIHKHAEKHFNDFQYGEKSKNYTMKHLRDVINNPDYVTYSVKHSGFIFYKELMEYVAVTIKPTEDYPDVFCVSTIYPSTIEKVFEMKKREKKILSKISKQRMDALLKKDKDLVSM